MALAFDASANGAASATSLTYAHTVSAGSNRIIFSTFYVDTSTDVATGVTYNTVTLTRVGWAKNLTFDGDYMYLLVAPASGSNNLVISLSGSQVIKAASVSYTGAKQTGQPDSSAVYNVIADSEPYTLSTTVVAANCWLVSGIGNDQDTLSISSGGIERDSNNVHSVGDSNGTVGTGSQSMVWLRDGSGLTDVVGVIASIAPAVTESASLSPSASRSPSASQSPSGSLSPSASLSPSGSPSPSASGSASGSSSPSASGSASASASPSPSGSPSATASASTSASESRSLSPSPSSSTSASTSASGSASTSASASASGSASGSASVSPSISPSGSLSPSASASASPSPACYTSKYSDQTSSYTSKYSDQTSSYTPKYKEWDELPSEDCAD